jgi:hypothetical protein
MSAVRTGAIISLLVALLFLMPTPLVQGFSVWTQDTDTDFNSGTLSNVEVTGTSSQASVQLKLTKAPGLLGEWLFDETSGTTVRDSGPNHKDGTASGTTIVDGNYNKARKFDGTSSLVDVPDDIWAEKLTLEAWVKIRDFGSTDPNYCGKGIFFKATDTGYARDYTFMALYDNNQKGLNFWFGNSGSEYVSLNYHGLTENVWYHLAATRDGSTAMIYVNGTEVASKSYSFTPANYQHPLGIGTSKYDYQTFDGLIDETRIYDRALNAQEIMAQYNSDTYGTYVSAPVDLGVGPHYGKLSMNLSIYDRTAIEVQLRSAKTQTGLFTAPYVGPNGTSATRYTVDGLPIWIGHNGDQWFQYKANFTSHWYGATPLLNQLKIYYNKPHTVNLVSPNGGENWTGNHNITWNASDPDGDPLVFRVWVSQDSGVTYPESYGVKNSVSSFDWDTDAYPNGTHYRIKIVATDPNPDMTITVFDTSNADFTIFHPAPIPPPPKNHPPVVETPPDGVVTHGDIYEQSINATDQDGDQLTYLVEGQKNIKMTLPNKMYWDTSSFSAGNYTFRVLVSDGKDFVEASWRVEVKKRTIIPPPSNSLPSVTLVAPANGAVINTTSVQLEWNGTDADGDRLTYLVKLDYSDGRTVVSTQPMTEWKASDLQPDTSYFWTVVASDGKANTSASSGIWSFTVRLPVQYNPPTCTILSPTNGSKVQGDVHMSGIAKSGGLPLLKVELSIDGGAWYTVTGNRTWFYHLQTTSLSNGAHNISARAKDGTYYSNVTSITITVDNHSILPVDYNTIVEGPLCPLLMAIIAVVIVCYCVVVALRNKSRK